VSILPESNLCAFLGNSRAEVNSRHHQAVGRIAPGFRAVAWHPETAKNEMKLIEGIEAEKGWALGVQWHPENLVNLESEAGRTALAIFQAFVKAVMQTNAR
jgi:putative glutamine amidotransferase